MTPTRSGRDRAFSISALIVVLLMVGAACATEDSAGGVDGTLTTGRTETSPSTVADTTSTSVVRSTSTSTTTEPTTSTTTSMDTSAEPVDTPEIVLLDAGDEPRVLLRTELTPGQTETMVMEQLQQIQQEIDGTPSPQAGGVPIITTQELVVVSVEDGISTISSVVTGATVGPGVDPELAAQIQPGLDPMIGLTTTSRMDDRGRILGTTVDGLDQLDPTTSAITEQLATSTQITNPLPEESVGVGAVWQATQLIENSGLVMEQVTTSKIISIDGPIVELSVDMVQLVDSGAQMNVGGATFTVVSWDLRGSGQVTLDLTRLVSTGSSQGRGVQEFEIGASVLTQTISFESTVAPG